MCWVSRKKKRLGLLEAGCLFKEKENKYSASATVWISFTVQHTVIPESAGQVYCELLTLVQQHLRSRASQNILSFCTQHRKGGDGGLPKRKYYICGRIISRTVEQWATTVKPLIVEVNNTDYLITMTPVSGWDILGSKWSVSFWSWWVWGSRKNWQALGSDQLWKGPNCDG